jgi:hypothetical protein
MSYRKLDAEQYLVQQASLVDSNRGTAAAAEMFVSTRRRLQQVLGSYARERQPNTPTVGSILRPHLLSSTANLSGGLSQPVTLTPTPYDTDVPSRAKALQDREILTAVDLVGSLPLRPEGVVTAVQVGSVGVTRMALHRGDTPLVRLTEVRGSETFWFVEGDYRELTLVADGVLHDLRLFSAEWQSGSSYADYHVPIEDVESFVVSARWTSTSEVQSIPTGRTPSFGIRFEVVTETESAELDPILNGFRLTSERAYVNPTRPGHMSDPIFTQQSHVILRVVLEQPHLVLHDLLIDTETR